MGVTITSNRMSEMPREEKPELRIYFVPGAMRNPEGVSYKPEPEA